MAGKLVINSGNMPCCYTGYGGDLRKHDVSSNSGIAMSFTLLHSMLSYIHVILYHFMSVYITSWKSFCDFTSHN